MPYRVGSCARSGAATESIDDRWQNQPPLFTAKHRRERYSRKPWTSRPFTDWPNKMSVDALCTEHRHHMTHTDRHVFVPSISELFIIYTLTASLALINGQFLEYRTPQPKCKNKNICCCYRLLRFLSSLRLSQERRKKFEILGGAARYAIGHA